MSTDTCASCSRFPLAESMATGGNAECAGFERPARWDGPACVLHLRATDRRHRVILVKQLRQKEENGQPEPQA